MKKLVALLLSIMMLCASVVALAEAPEGYPEITRDIDFGGKTIYIYDYWTTNPARQEEPNERQQATYDYQDWLFEQFNCTVVQTAKGGWDSNVQELVNFCLNPDDTLCFYILPPDFLAGPMTNKQLEVLNFEGSPVDFNDEKWHAGIKGFASLGDTIYGMYVGTSEPRQGIYFNKRVLEEAGIDYNDIYDMQAAGTWTWEAFETMLKTVHRDIDNDGVIDVYGMTGNNTDTALISVFSNGASFFDYDENGKLQIAINSDAGIEALNWARTIWNTYSMPQPEGTEWNYFEDTFEWGTSAFCCHQGYAYFGGNPVYGDMEDEIGWVAFPKGPKGTEYTHIATDNVTVIPNVYDDKTVADLLYLYDLWTNPTPGYEEDDSWAEDFYAIASDDRCIDETYAMLRQTGVMNKALLLGSTNDVLGSDFLWNLFWSDVTSIIEAKTPAWEGMLEIFNAAQ